jgi:hypothetical protein
LTKLTARALSKLDYGVLALGDSNYEKFCGFGRFLDERLAELGGVRLLDRNECDGDPDPTFEQWSASISAALKARLGGSPGTSTVTLRAAPLQAAHLPRLKLVLGDLVRSPRRLHASLLKAVWSGVCSRLGFPWRWPEFLNSRVWNFTRPRLDDLDFAASLFDKFRSDRETHSAIFVCAIVDQR